MPKNFDTGLGLAELACIWNGTKGTLHPQTEKLNAQSQIRKQSDGRTFSKDECPKTELFVNRDALQWNSRTWWIGLADISAACSQMKASFFIRGPHVARLDHVMACLLALANTVHGAAESNKFIFLFNACPSLSQACTMCHNLRTLHWI